MVSIFVIAASRHGPLPAGSVTARVGRSQDFSHRGDGAGTPGKVEVTSRQAGLRAPQPGHPLAVGRGEVTMQQTRLRSADHGEGLPAWVLPMCVLLAAMACAVVLSVTIHLMSNPQAPASPPPAVSSGR
jgi:hypothetical protein